MALGDVGQLVRQHRGQFVGAGGQRDQPEVHADIAAGQREGVDAAVAPQKDLEGQLLRGVGRDLAALARRFDQRLPHALHIVEQRRVVQVGRVAADLAHDLLAQRTLGAQAELLAGRFAQRRQAHLGVGRMQRQPGAQHAGEEQGAHARRKGGSIQGW